MSEATRFEARVRHRTGKDICRLWLKAVPGNGDLLLSRLYVLPTHQRRGVGDALLAAVVARHPGAVRIQLLVEARNTKGLTFYGRHGFVAVGRVEEDGSSSLRMQRIVGA